MKLLPLSLAAVAYANQASVTCMDDDNNKIQMKATVPKSIVSQPLSDLDSNWKVDGDNYVRTWNQADASTGAFTTNQSNDLVWTETQSEGCKQHQEGSVTVCVKTGHTLTFTCSYSLDDQTKTSTFDVSGHDTVKTANGQGTLNYSLKVTGGAGADNDDFQIGNAVSVEIEPANPNLVFARLQDCFVNFSSQSFPITKYNTVTKQTQPTCEVGTSVSTSQGQNKLEFGWTAFKWATATETTENQQVQCTIGLSKDSDGTYGVGTCPSG